MVGKPVNLYASAALAVESGKRASERASEQVEARTERISIFHNRWSGGIIHVNLSVNLSFWNNSLIDQSRIYLTQRLTIRMNGVRSLLVLIWFWRSGESDYNFAIEWASKHYLRWLVGWNFSRLNKHHHLNWPNEWAASKWMNEIDIKKDGMPWLINKVSALDVPLAIDAWLMIDCCVKPARSPACPPAIVI